MKARIESPKAVSSSRFESLRQAKATLARRHPFGGDGGYGAEQLTVCSWCSSLAILGATYAPKACSWM